MGFVHLQWRLGLPLGFADYAPEEITIGLAVSGEGSIGVATAGVGSFNSGPLQAKGWIGPRLAGSVQ